MRNQLLEDLAAVRELLDRPERWTQGALAQDADGFTVSVRDARACRWCLDGAIRRVTAPAGGLAELLAGYERVDWRRRDVRHALSGSGSGAALASWNDEPETTHGQVLAAIDDAMARAVSA